MHGARLRQREAWAQPEALRRGVDRDQEVEIAALAEHDEGRGRSPTSAARRRLMPLLPDAVGREPVEPEAQNALRG
jgi:hypothetical protein